MSGANCLFVTDNTLCLCLTVVQIYSLPTAHHHHHFILLGIFIPSRLPSKSPTNIKNASALLAPPGFMMWVPNVLTPGPSLFIASLLADFFFLKGTTSVRKSFHWGGIMDSLILGGESLIEHCPICGLFWLHHLTVLETGWYAYGILK